MAERSRGPGHGGRRERCDGGLEQDAVLIDGHAKRPTSADTKGPHDTTAGDALITDRGRACQRTFGPANRQLAAT
jgi:hypothetical protein